MKDEYRAGCQRRVQLDLEARLQVMQSARPVNINIPNCSWKSRSRTSASIITPVARP